MVTKISDGYKLVDFIGTKSENDGTFNIAKGNFEFTIDVNGNIIKIMGDGIVEFPNVVIFKQICESFAWGKIKDHI